jgi:hypothetical protein
MRKKPEDRLEKQGKKIDTEHRKLIQESMNPAGTHEQKAKLRSEEPTNGKTSRT